MKIFKFFLVSFSIFTFILLSSNPLSARQKFDKGDKVEVKLEVNNQEVWAAGIYEKYKKGKHRVSYTYNVDGWKGGGEYHPFEDNEIRPFTGNITTSFYETASNKAKVEGSPYQKGDKVEIKIPVNGQDVWIEGMYVVFDKNEHRVSYTYNIDGWKGYGQLKPFSDENIRPFTGNITTSFYDGLLQKSFDEGQKVEILLSINGEPVWVMGIYAKAYEGKHRVSYQYDIEGKKGRGNNMPFSDDEIRPFIGDSLKSFER